MRGFFFVNLPGGFMKYFVMLSVLFSVSTFAKFDLKSECFKEADKLDRDYCHGKRMKAYKTILSNDKKTWGKSLNAKTKKAKLIKNENDIIQRKFQIQSLQDELKLLNTYRSDISKAKIVTAKKKKKKKSKDDDLKKALKKLGIKL
jgi:hypothetical protein